MFHSYVNVYQICNMICLDDCPISMPAKRDFPAMELMTPRRIDVSLLAIHRVVPAATRHGGVAPRRHVELTENAEGVLV